MELDLVKPGTPSFPKMVRNSSTPSPLTQGTCPTSNLPPYILLYYVPPFPTPEGRHAFIGALQKQAQPLLRR